MSDNYLGSNISISDERGSTGKSFSVKSSENIQRNALPKPVKDFARKTQGVQMWETDPQMLYDYSENLIVDAFIDTLAKDVSNTGFLVDENDSFKDLLMNPHPEKDSTEIFEELMNDLLRTGNAFIVVNRYEDGSPAELTVPPAPTMFKVIGDDGFTKGYVQKIGRKQTNPIDTDNVIHFKWSNQNNRYYGKGPTEMSLDQIDIIDELLLKEILDLTEGGVSNIISQTDSHDRDPMDSQEWSSLVNTVNANKGERQENIVAKGSWDATTISTDYKNLKLIDRYKFHIQTLASAYKVNPSYVGFDFENTNRATDESQREAYKQRGIKTSLNQIRTKLNHFLQQEYGEGKFAWDIETERDIDEIDYYTKLAETVQVLQESGVEFNIEDGHINIPDDADINQTQLNSIEEVRVLNEIHSEVDLQKVLDANSNLEDVEEESGEKDFDACVESVLEDNPDLTEEEAQAICATKEIEVTDKKQKFIDAVEYGGEDFVESLVLLDHYSDSRRDAINTVKDKMDGFSPNTYYKWLDMVDLK